MPAPRLVVDLCKIRENTRDLVKSLAPHGVSVTGVTKAFCGHPKIAQAMLDGGAAGLADARLSHIQRLRAAGLTCRMSMIRPPMASQVQQIVRHCDVSYNTELAIISKLSAAAGHIGVTHDVILMVEMGDMRDGIMPDDVIAFAKCVCDMPHVALTGIAANYACLSSAAPTKGAVAKLGLLAKQIEQACGLPLSVVSGGNSTSLPLYLGQSPTQQPACTINDLRIGEAILLGVEPVSQMPISGLHTDAVRLIAEVIEAKPKPAHANLAPHPGKSGVCNQRVVLALGQQDTDISGIKAARDVTIVGTTSDHLIISTNNPLYAPGCEMAFDVNYTALARSMNAVDVAITIPIGS